METFLRDFPGVISPHINPDLGGGGLQGAGDVPDVVLGHQGLEGQGHVEFFDLDRLFICQCEIFIRFWPDHVVHGQVGQPGVLQGGQVHLV